jgi:transposase
MSVRRPRWGTPRSGGERQALSVHCGCCWLLAGSAINASTEAQQQVFSLVIAAPEPIRARFRGQKLAAMLTTAAKLRVHASWDVETTSTVVALRTLARRAHAMLKEAHERDAGHHPQLAPRPARGVRRRTDRRRDGAVRLVPPRPYPLRSGVRDARRRRTHPPNSGQVTTRYRLNRYGDRQLNNALHTVVQSRIQYQQPTRNYIARRTAEGKNGREIKRCLARYVARDLRSGDRQ